MGVHGAPVWLPLNPANPPGERGGPPGSTAGACRAPAAGPCPVVPSTFPAALRSRAVRSPPLSPEWLRCLPSGHSKGGCYLVPGAGLSSPLSDALDLTLLSLQHAEACPDPRPEAHRASGYVVPAARQTGPADRRRESRCSRVGGVLGWPCRGNRPPADSGRGRCPRPHTQPAPPERCPQKGSPWRSLPASAVIPKDTDTEPATVLGLSTRDSNDLL